MDWRGVSGCVSDAEDGRGGTPLDRRCSDATVAHDVPWPGGSRDGRKQEENSWLGHPQAAAAAAIENWMARVVVWSSGRLK